MKKVPLILLVLLATQTSCPYQTKSEATYLQPKTVKVSKLPNSKIFRKPIIVAVIDTGLDIDLFKDKIKLCKYGHRDFTGTGIKDNHGHGTHISGLIDENADDANYCQVVIKYYDPNATAKDNLANTIKAFQWAVELKVDVINYSGGGLMWSGAEERVVLAALNDGIRVVAAAGNEGCDLEKCDYFPALYDSRINIVGNIDSDRKPAKSSNYGNKVTDWEFGVGVLSYCISGLKTCRMTGTSQSTAIHSGKVIKEINEFRKTLTIEKVIMLIHTV